MPDAESPGAQLTPRSADDFPVLVCMNCAHPIVFADNGWSHRDPAPECPGLVVAWPPQGPDDDAA